MTAKRATPPAQRRSDADVPPALALVLAGGIALDWLCLGYPARLPAWAPWDFSWPEYLAAVLALWLYGRGLLRSPRAARPSNARRLCFLAGVALTYAVLQTRFDYLAQHMFTLTRVQHLVTHHLGPFLIALGWPGATLARGLPAPLRRLCAAPALDRAIARVQQPLIAGGLFVGLIVLSLIPPVLFRTMLDPRLYAIMNWSMVADGLLFWMLVLDPRPGPPARLPRSLRLLLVFATQFPQIMLGAAIGFADGVLYPYYDLCGRLYPAIDAQTDQQIGGFVIWFGGGMMGAIAAMMLLRAMWQEEQALHPAAARLTVPESGPAPDAWGRSSPS